MIANCFRACKMLLPCVGLALFLAGCSDSGLIKLSGTVTLDGQPVEDGSISLMPVDGKGVTGGGLISNGKYTAESSPGEMAVQIYAYKTVTRANPTAEEIERGITDDRVELLPPVYNRQSKLRIQVSSSDRNFDFPLTSQGDIPAGFTAP